ncbi:MAG: hypothetical protein AAFR58_25350 [Cyanobacteria bacterium J06627_28]
MSEQNKKPDAPETQLSEDELKEVAGGKNVHQRRLDHLDSQSKSVEDIQETRLEHLDNQTK